MKVLIVIDMQNDFIDGSLGSSSAKEIVSKVKLRVEEYKKNNYQVIYTKDTHTEDYLNTTEGKYLPIKHCIKNTIGHDIHKLLDTTNCIIVEKETFGCFDLKNYINEEVTSIELCGLCTDICVVSNALILKTYFKDKEIIVNSNLCAGTSEKLHQEALDVLRSCHVNVI